MRMLSVLAGLALVAGLAACGGEPQAYVERASGVPAYMGAGGGPYTVEGWKAGDRTSWEEATRRRAQAGQNEYARTGGGG